MVYAKLLEHLESDILKNIKLGLGYSIIRRGSDLTTPNAIFTSQSIHGLTLNAAYEMPFDDESHIDTYLQVYLPWAFSEDSNFTGFHTTTLGWELGAEFNHNLTPRIDVSAGVTVRQDMNGFTGVGARGTTNGSESLLTISIPMNVTFKF